MVVPGYLLVPGTGTGYRYNNINIMMKRKKKRKTSFQDLQSARARNNCRGTSARRAIVR